MDNFIKWECCDCGVLSAVSKNLYDNWKSTKNTFCCPNGHRQSFVKSTAEILKEQLGETNRLLSLQESRNYLLEKKNEFLSKQVKKNEEVIKKVAKKVVKKLVTNKK